MSKGVSDTRERTFEVLLVEDNPGDIVLVQEAMKEIDSRIKLNVLNSGFNVADFLRSRDPSKENPDLIILDLNLPQKDGFEVLRELKENPATQQIPVVIFTSSHSHKDILKTYGLGGVCLITKPLGFYEFIESIKSITTNFLK